MNPPDSQHEFHLRQCPEHWKRKTNQYTSVQSLSRVRLFATPRTTAHQVPLSSTFSWSLLKFMSHWVSDTISNHLILCHPLLFLPSIFPTSGSFPVSWLIASGGQSIGASASVFSSERQFKGTNSLVLCLLYCPALISEWPLGRPYPWLYLLSVK